MRIDRFFYFTALLVLNILVHGRINMFVKKFEPCIPKTIYPLNWNITVKTIGRQQFFNGYINLEIPFDDNLRTNFSIEILYKKGFQYLFSVTERSACSAMHKNMGAFINDLEKYVGLEPGVCPIKKQKLYLRDYPLNFDGISSAALPPGTLRFTDVAQDRNNAIVGCNVIVIENKLH